MARYSASFLTNGVNTTNNAVAVLANTGTSQRLRVMQVAVGVNLAPTTGPSFYLSRITARGTQTSTIAGQPFDTGDPASIGTVDQAWSVAPTFSTTLQIVRGGLGVSAGGWWVWDFRDSPIIIPNTAASGLAIVNALATGTTTGSFAGYITWEE